MSPRHVLGSYDAATALVVVDVQYDFADPAGSLFVPGGDEVVEVVNAEVDAARSSGASVAYSQDWHPPSTPHFEKDGGIWPVHCVQDTPGAQLVAGLDVAGPVVRKGTQGEDGYSAFSVRDPLSGAEDDTELDAILRDRGVERVVIAGLALDYCVKDTALDARSRGYTTEVLADATRAVNRQPGDGSRAVAEMVAAGVSIR